MKMDKSLLHQFVSRKWPLSEVRNIVLQNALELSDEESE